MPSSFRVMINDWAVGCSRQSTSISSGPGLAGVRDIRLIPYC